MSDAKYINQSLMDGLLVLKKFMAELSPFTWYGIAELSAALGAEFNDQKTRRIVKTLQAAGLLDADSAGNRYQLSREVISLSYNYLQALKRTHQQLKNEVDAFKID